MASQETIRRFVQIRGDVPLMKRMLAVSIPHVNVVDTTLGNFTALMYQTFYGTIDSMEFLLTCDPPADPNAKNSDNRTILQLAVISNDPAKIRLLLEHGADRNAKGERNLTALELARKVYSYYTECIQVLQSYFPENKR